MLCHNCFLQLHILRWIRSDERRPDYGHSRATMLYRRPWAAVSMPSARPLTITIFFEVRNEARALAVSMPRADAFRDPTIATLGRAVGDFFRCRRKAYRVRSCAPRHLTVYPKVRRARPSEFRSGRRLHATSTFRWPLICCLLLIVRFPKKPFDT